MCSFVDYERDGGLLSASIFIFESKSEEKMEKIFAPKLIERGVRCAPLSNVRPI